MKRIKATAETRELKELIKWQREKIIKLETKIDVMEEEAFVRYNIMTEELIESRAKEGKGALEKMMDGIADAVVGLGKMFSTMFPDDLKALVEVNDHDFDNLEIEGQEDDDNAI